MRAIKNMAVFETEADIRAIEPDFDYIAGMDGLGLIVTAPGDGSDCASRYFAPHAGIDEDPVTGSAHCTIVPYWADVLGKDDIHARQVSARSGDLYCRMNGDRVVIGGKARLVIEGTFRL
jgi:predicted PhzF superfamily epimerase YddE/YHI9